MLAMIDSDRNIRYLYISAGCFGFAFMAKGLHAAIIVLICFIYVIATGKLKQLKLKNYLLLILFGLLPVLPWAITRYLQDGTELFVRMFTRDVVERVKGEAEPMQHIWYYYFTLLAGNFAVLLAALLCAGGLGRKMIFKRKMTREQIGYILWLTVPLFVFSLSVYKPDRYIFTLMFAFAIAGGISAKALYRSAKPVFFKAAIIVVFACGVLFGVGKNLVTIQKLPSSSYQNAVKDMLDRDMNSDMHVYIQFTPEKSTWTKDMLLVAELAGDVICIDGGIEAFEQDEEYAILIIDRTCVTNELLGMYPVYYESYYVWALQN